MGSALGQPPSSDYWAPPTAWQHVARTVNVWPFMNEFFKQQPVQTIRILNITVQEGITELEEKTVIYATKFWEQYMNQGTERAMALVFFSSVKI